MGFLYPLFLLAGLSLAIPVLIHLFNLRRYKTVVFPHTRFLRNISLQSRRQREVQNRWLLLLRLLFLAALVLAFAQPFFKKKDALAAGTRLRILYLDNSYSTSLKAGARTGLDAARDALRRQVGAAGPADRFILLTAGGPVNYTPQAADKTLAALDAVTTSPVARPSDATLGTVQSLLQTEGAAGADVYWASDFGRAGFNPRPAPELIRGIRFHGIPVQARAPRNFYIDTAMLLSPVLQAGQEARLVVKSRRVGAAPAAASLPTLQLSVDGQVKSAATPFSRTGGTEDTPPTSDLLPHTSTDTLTFSTDASGWHRIQLVLADGLVPFDDTFRITARSAPSLSVLVLHQGAPNPYVQAAFRAYSGFNVSRQDVSSPPASFADYNLVILSGVTRLDGALAASLGKAVRDGLSLAILPGRAEDVGALNTALSSFADIRIEGIDTAQQAATQLQSGADLVRDLFEAVPPNVQLPIASWHYRLRGGYGSGAQSILSFRSGDPMLAQYAPGRGRLYVLSTGADAGSGNFAASYFFVPFLYQMAAQSRGGDVYALTAGANQPAFLPLTGADERLTVHLYGAGGLDAVPPQRPSGAGLDVFVDGAVQQPGFYRLAAGTSAKDSAVVALNADRSESPLEVWTPEELKRAWPGEDATWNAPGTEVAARGGGVGSWPLWRVLAILALGFLALETWMLARRPPPAKATPAPTQ